MKAFKVHFSTPRGAYEITVLSPGENSIEANLCAKSAEYKRYNYSGGSRINSIKELHLHNVMLTELSVTELISVIRRNKEDD